MYTLQCTLFDPSANEGTLSRAERDFRDESSHHSAARFADASADAASGAPSVAVASSSVSVSSSYVLSGASNSQGWLLPYDDDPDPTERRSAQTLDPSREGGTDQRENNDVAVEYSICTRVPNLS